MNSSPLLIKSRLGPEEGALTTVLDEFQPPVTAGQICDTANRFLPIKVRAFLDFYAAAEASLRGLGRHRRDTAEPRS